MKSRGDGWIFSPEYETMPRKRLEKLQEERLRKIVNYCYERVPLYKHKFKSAGITPSDISTLEDLTKIPLTLKTDLRDTNPYSMIATSLDNVIELHASSGTTGNPTTCAYTKNDLEIWSTVMARTYASAGARKGDIVQNAYGYGLFTGGLGFHYGALKLGLAVLPISAGETERQLRLAKEYGTTILACTPTYAAHLGEFLLEKIGKDPREELKWRIGIFGAEACSEELRQRIEDLLGLEAFDVYGLSEIIGPGVSIECPQHNGLHIHEDHFLAEVVNPSTGETVDEGETGELVLTTLTREATPRLRFRTGDLTKLSKEGCECARTIARMARVIGRVDDMLKVRGAKFWPSTVEHALLMVEGASQNYEIVIDRQEELDIMVLRVEPAKELYDKVGRDLSKLQGLCEAICNSVKSFTSVKAKIELVPYGSLPRFLGKAKRVTDQRKEK